MKRVISLAAALGALASAPTLAADLAKAPVYKAAPAVVVANWTGFYIGVHAGGGWGEAEVSPTFGPAFTPAQIQVLTPLASPTLDTSGALGGFQAGYNFQTGSTVLGIEADFSFSGIRGSRSLPIQVFPPALALLDRSFSEEDKLKWVSTFRGRVGYATPSLLIYATGGLAVGRRDFSQFIVTDPAVNFNNLRASVSETRLGWTAGGGLEYALSRNWSIKGEYLYVDLGKVSAFADSDTAPGFGLTLNTSSHLRLHTARAGLNYKLDWGGPVVAKH